METIPINIQTRKHKQAPGWVSTRVEPVPRLLSKVTKKQNKVKPENPFVYVRLFSPSSLHGRMDSASFFILSFLLASFRALCLFISPSFFSSIPRFPFVFSQKGSSFSRWRRRFPITNIFSPLFTLTISSMLIVVEDSHVEASLPVGRWAICWL